MFDLLVRRKFKAVFILKMILLILEKRKRVTFDAIISAVSRVESSDDNPLQPSFLRSRILFEEFKRRDAKIV